MRFGIEGIFSFTYERSSWSNPIHWLLQMKRSSCISGYFRWFAPRVASKYRYCIRVCFLHPMRFLGKARQYGLHTDASHRYRTWCRSCITSQSNGHHYLPPLLVAMSVQSSLPKYLSLSHRPQVSLRAERLTRVVGIEFKTEQVTEILQRLGMEVSYSNSVWLATVPAYRFDIQIEEDLIEEVARVYGYNNIPNVAPTGQLAMLPRKESELGVNAFKAVLLQQGYDEAITYSFVDPKTICII